MRQTLRIVCLAALCVCLPFFVEGAAASVAVFPLQELGAGRNEVNLPFTRALSQKLEDAGNDVTRHETIIAFMSHNRIRTVGYMETFHVSRVREDLGAAFILLGTVSQNKERPLPAMGLTLQLVRTSDARTVWSYVGHVSVGDERKPLGIGEPRSVSDLQKILLADILDRWPWEIVREVQQGGVVNVDAFTLDPPLLRTGSEITARVRLRGNWHPGRTPRVFLKADDQFHAATLSADGSTWEASWVAGEKEGRFPVALILEWPLYGRSETALLGTYLVDNTPPLFEIELRGTRDHEGVPTFRHELTILPRLLVRKPLDRWRLAFHDSAGVVVGSDEGVGRLPERFIWAGRRTDGDSADDGQYEVVIEVWDKAGNKARDSRRVARSRSIPGVEVTVARNGQEMVVDLEQSSKVPLAFWRMEMWTREGRLLTETEGRDLPAQVGFELPDAEQNPEIEGFLIMQDALGNRVRRKLDDVLGLAAPPSSAAVQEEPAAFSETWVDEF